MLTETRTVEVTRDRYVSLPAQDTQPAPVPKIPAEPTNGDYETALLQCLTGLGEANGRLRSIRRINEQRVAEEATGAPQGEE